MNLAQSLRFKSFGLRARLVILILLALTSGSALFAYRLIETRNDAISAASVELLASARLMASESGDLTGHAHALMAVLATLPDIRGLRNPECSAIVARVLKQDARYAFIGAVDADAMVTCSAVPLTKPVSVLDRAWFKRVAEMRDFVVGGYAIGRGSGKRSVHLAYPLLSDSGGFSGAINVALDLDELNRRLSGLALPPNRTVAILDPDGTVLAARGWLAGSTRWPASEQFIDVVKQQREGVTEFSLTDNNRHVFAFTPLGGLNQASLIVALGASRDDLLKEANKGFVQNLLALLAVTTAMFAATWYGIKVWVLQPVRALVGAAQQVSAGDLSTRIGPGYPGAEIGHVARAFDNMTRSLATQVEMMKRAEEEIRALNENLERRVAERTRELEEASRAKSDFLANMSHELRTPLNAIIGFSEMLKDGVLGELEAKQRGFVGDIFDAGTHLLALINDILDLSKVEAGMLRLEQDAVDVAALLKASLLIVREKAHAHRIKLDVQIDPALGVVLADERKVKQIVYNLLANAMKFTPDGGVVTLFARFCPRAGVAPDPAMPGRLLPLPDEASGEFLEIAVEDTGIGIAEEHLAKLFQPFVQIDSSTTRRAGGTGLGLAMVRRLAELHGGTVGVASRPGIGSRFSVWLPYRVFAAELPAGLAPAAPERAAPAGRPLGLVIEDDDRAAGLIEAQLLSEGYDVMRAATAEEGLVRAAKRKPDLITLDIFLPEMDGWEFLRRLKAHPALREVPVVIVTVAEDGERGLALGARRVLQKPFTREQLGDVLAGLVARRTDGEAPCVLVVDDNVKAVELVATALEAEGYRVLRAYGGAEAIAAAREALPDLIILDLMMPQVSGFEVAKTLRESESTARIPILVLTAKDLTAEDRARLNGALTAILQKASFSRSELLAELRRALPKRID